MPTGGGGGGVGGFPVNLYQIGITAASSVIAVANKVSYSGFGLLAPLTFANIVVNVNAADGANNSDIGIYSATGAALLANIGAQHISGTGTQAFAIVQTSVTLLPGRYVFAFTSAASTFALNRDNNWLSWCANSSGVGTSVGGALPASIPAPTVAIAFGGTLISALYS